MVKYVQCVTRKPGLEAIEFRTHWNEYARRLEELVRQAPNILRFSVSTTLMVQATATLMIEYGASTPYDGMVEMWLEDATITAKNLRENKQIQALLHEIGESLRDYVDRDRSTAFFASEDMAFDRRTEAARHETSVA